MTLHLIRHLPTALNQQGILQGSQNISIIPPNEELKAEIIFNQQKIRALDLDLILTSDLNRTKETARAYGFYDFSVDPLINELNFGKYEGKPKTLMLKEIGEVWQNEPQSLVLGESLKDFERRMIQFIKKYSNLSQILVFAHGAVIRALLSVETNGTIDRMNYFEVKNNELFTLNF